MAANSNERIKIEKQLDRVMKQNAMLKEQIELRKENSDLKTANILAQILSWMEKIHSNSDITIDEEVEPAKPVQSYSDPASRTGAKIADPTAQNRQLQFSDDTKSTPAAKRQREPNTSRGPMKETDLSSPGPCPAPCKPKACSTPCSPCGPSQCAPSVACPAPCTPSAACPSPYTPKAAACAPCKPEYAACAPGPSYMGRSSPRQQSTPNSDGPPVLRSIGLSSIADDSYLDQDQKSQNISGPDTVPISTRFIGEIAFQLDRRLLSYIFNGHRTGGNVRRRFYGFTIPNIPEMIDIECRTENGYDEQARMAMSYRYQYIFNRMKMLGYDLNTHPMFSVKMVNQFGLLNVSSQGMGQSLQLQDPDILQAILAKISPKEDLKDITILLDCLVYLAHDEGKPLFIY